MRRPRASERACPEAPQVRGSLWLTARRRLFFIPPHLKINAGSIIDFDWSNAKAIWAKNRPMNDEELLQEQVVMSTSASLGQTVWVYRGSMWAYPWYTSVRKTLEDPAYADWYVPFKPNGPWYSNKCDNNYSPPICSNLYRGSLDLAQPAAATCPRFLSPLHSTPLHSTPLTHCTHCCPNVRSLRRQPGAVARVPARRRRLRRAQLRLRQWCAVRLLLCVQARLQS
jgi:hypothetical protein